MALQGIDYAVRHSPTQLECLHDQGVRFVARYLSRPDLTWKHLTSDEVAELSEAGLNIISVYQARNNEIGDFTLELADRDAEMAVNHAKSLNQPPGTAIYFAVDFQAKSDQMPTIRAYLIRVRDIIAESGYIAGVYGSYSVIEATKDIVAFRWQTYAWSSNRVHSEAQFLQYHNGANLCGGNNGRNKAFAFPGWWNPSGVVEHNYDPPEPEVTPPAPGAMTEKELQTALNRLGMNAGTVDGVIGPITRLAIARFQLAYAFEKITVDGVPGPQTYAAIKRCLGDEPMNDRLSPHFFVYELRSRTRPGSLKDNDCFIHRDTLFALEALRTAVGKPLGIVSGYRTRFHNNEVGGASASQHTYGYAPELIRLTNIDRTHLRMGRAADFNRGYIKLASARNLRLFGGIGYIRNLLWVTHGDTRPGSVTSPTTWPYG